MTTAPAQPRYVSLARAAGTLGVSVRTVQRIIERGELTSYRLAGRRTLRVELDEVLGLLEPDQRQVASCH